MFVLQFEHISLIGFALRAQQFFCGLGKRTVKRPLRSSTNVRGSPEMDKAVLRGGSWNNTQNKARKVRSATRRLRQRVEDYHSGRISFGELEASIIGWSAHAAHADSWGLRRYMFDQLAIKPAEHRRALNNRG